MRPFKNHKWTSAYTIEVMAASLPIFAGSLMSGPLLPISTAVLLAVTKIGEEHLRNSKERQIFEKNLRNAVETDDLQRIFESYGVKVDKQLQAALKVVREIENQELKMKLPRLVYSGDFDLFAFSDFSDQFSGGEAMVVVDHDNKSALWMDAPWRVMEGLDHIQAFEKFPVHLEMNQATLREFFKSPQITEGRNFVIDDYDWGYVNALSTKTLFQVELIERETGRKEIIPGQTIKNYKNQHHRGIERLAKLFVSGFISDITEQTPRFAHRSPDWHSFFSQSIHERRYEKIKYDQTTREMYKVSDPFEITRLAASHDQNKYLKIKSLIKDVASNELDR